jgi:carboxyl-terminal processing protease
MRKYYQPFFYGVAIALWGSMAFLMGFVLRAHLESPSASSSEFSLTEEVQDLLDRVYLREQPDLSVREYGMVRGLLGVLNDPNTFFIEPPVAQSEADVLAGTYGGIGVQLNRSETGEFLMYPFDDGPAARVGIQDGAVLVAVNNRPITLSDHPDAVDQMLRGEVKDNNGVVIIVRQNDAEEEFFIAFDVIAVPSIMFRQLADDSRIGYIQIMRFTSRTPEELVQALQELNRAPVEAYILDLRNNTGGLLEESVRVADEFVDAGTIMIERSRTNEREYTANAGGQGIEIPLVVLINNRTASAAELVAGAIRDSGRGILIGQRSYGKGTVQQIFTLSDGSSVHITAAEWLTPGRISLGGTGLIPNIEMIPDENGRDVEMGEAIRHIRSILDS